MKRMLLLSFSFAALATTQLAAQQPGSVLSTAKISAEFGGLDRPDLLLCGEAFANSAATEVGDLNDDGVPDLIIGHPGYEEGTGRVLILFMNPNGTIMKEHQINAEEPEDADFFGNSLGMVGDLDGDGKPELGVCAIHDDFDPQGLNIDQNGAVFLIELDIDASIPSAPVVQTSLFSKISIEAGHHAWFGTKVAPLGDLDRDGVDDISIAAFRADDLPLTESGAIWVLLMNSDGTVKSEVRISDATPGIDLSSGEGFGHALTNIGDLNGDGRAELAVGAPRTDISGIKLGSEYFLFLNSDGTLFHSQRIEGFMQQGRFGWASANLGDLDADGTCELGVGAYAEDGNTGALYVLFLDVGAGSSPTVTLDHHVRIGYLDVVGLESNDRFGWTVSRVSLATGEFDIAVGAVWDDDIASGVICGLPGKKDVGALWLLDLAQVAVEAREKLKTVIAPIPCDPQNGTLQASQNMGPVLGKLWDPVVDHSTFYSTGALFDGLYLSVPLPGGPQCTNNGFQQVQTLGFTPTWTPAGTRFSIPMPTDCSLLGLSFPAQALTFGNPGVCWASVIEVTFGNF